MSIDLFNRTGASDRLGCRAGSLAQAAKKRPLRGAPSTLALALFGAGAAAMAADRPAPPPVYPGATWASLSPAEAGMDPSKLDAAIAKSGTTIGCVVRHGYMVKAWGAQRRLSAGGSEIKPLFAHLLFDAVDAGRLAHLDEFVATYELGLNELNRDRGYKDRRIRFRHMANQISCYSSIEDPGTAYDYNDYQMALFGDTLFFKVWRAASFADFTTRVMQPRLTRPLQMEDSHRWDDNGRFPISARDACRFTLLYLRRGAWNGRQIISANDALAAVSSAQPGTFPDTTQLDAEALDNPRSMGNFNGLKNPGDRHDGSYSFAWWTNGKDRHGQRRLPDCPPDLFGCEGGGGTAGVHAFPELDLIVAFRISQKNRLSDPKINAFYRDILAAVVNPGPANAAPVAAAGADRRIMLPAPAALGGAASDDGEPTRLITLWHFISGPGRVVFAAPNAPRTSATFSDPGRYVLRLTATDGSRTAGDDLVVDVDPPSGSLVTIEPTDSEAAEAGGDPGVFIVRRFGPTDTALAVQLQSLGTAVPGEDCRPIAMAATILAGTRTASIHVTPIDDQITEGRESVFLALVPGVSYTIGMPSGAGVMIEDNDAALPVVIVSAHDSKAAEPANLARFVISASMALHGKTVRFTLGGTARNGEDYRPIPESITFSDMLNPVFQIPVTPIDDSIREGAETVTLTLLPGPDYAVGTQRSATVVIMDDD